MADPVDLESPRLARCASLLARVAYARKLRTVADLGDGSVLELLGPAFTPAAPAEADIVVASGVLEHLADPDAFLRALTARALVCSSPWGGRWDFESYRALVEGSGWQVLRHEAVGPLQVIAAARADDEHRAEPGPAERTWTVPRYAIIPTHNRPEQLRSLAASLGAQCDVIVVLDNASTPPVDRDEIQIAAGQASEVYLIRDEEQPPNLARFWNVMLDAIAVNRANPADPYDVAILNDDAIVPPGWYDACARGLRSGAAQVAHTEPTSPALLTRIHNNPRNRMCPHAIVVRGEAGQRADESMRWWYFDTDWDLTARQNGGVLSVPGPRVVNSLANATTVGPLAEQAEKDCAVFEAKWSR